MVWSGLYSGYLCVPPGSHDAPLPAKRRPAPPRPSCFPCPCLVIDAICNYNLQASVPPTRQVLPGKGFSQSISLRIQSMSRFRCLAPPPLVTCLAPPRSTPPWSSPVPCIDCCPSTLRRTMKRYGSVSGVYRLLPVNPAQDHEKIRIRVWRVSTVARQPCAANLVWPQSLELDDVASIASRVRTLTVAPPILYRPDFPFKFSPSLSGATYFDSPSAAPLV